MKSISPPHRERNGRRQRVTTKAEIEAAQRQAGEREMSVVMAQPHRRGERSQLAVSSWGRFCLKHKLARELFDAGERYGDIYRRYIMMTQSRYVEGHVSGGWSGHEPTPEAIMRAKADFGAAETILISVSRWSMPNLHYMVIDFPTEDATHIGGKERRAVINGALALARHFYGRHVFAH